MTAGGKNIGAKIVKPAAQSLFATVALIAESVRNKQLFFVEELNNQHGNIIRLRRTFNKLLNIVMNILQGLGQG